MQDPNKLIFFVVAFQVIAQGCKNILVQGFPFFYEINDMLNVVIMGGSLLMYVYALLTTGRLRIPVQTIAVLFFVGMTYLFTYMFFSQNAKYIQLTILKTLVTCFFTFLLFPKHHIVSQEYHQALSREYIYVHDICQHTMSTNSCQN
jgi:hypothetical protein